MFFTGSARKPSSLISATALAALVPCMLSNVGHAADIFWTNTAGGNWSVAANWTPNTVPGSSDNAFIISNGTYTVLLDSNATVRTLALGGSSDAQTLSNA